MNYSTTHSRKSLGVPSMQSGKRKVRKHLKARVSQEKAAPQLAFQVAFFWTIRSRSTFFNQLNMRQRETMQNPSILRVPKITEPQQGGEADSSNRSNCNICHPQMVSPRSCFWGVPCFEQISILPQLVRLTCLCRGATGIFTPCCFPLCGLCMVRIGRGLSLPLHKLSSWFLLR